LLREGRFAEALAAAKQAAELKPKDPSVHSLLSQVLFLTNDYKEALTEANIAVELAPDTARMKSQQAAMFWIMGQNDELRKACNFLKRGIEGKDEGPKYADVYFSSFWPYIFFSSLEDKKDAQELLNAASARMDGKVWPYPIIQYLRSELSEDELLKLKTDLWSLTEIHCYVGCSQYYAGEKDKAKQNLKWVIEHGRKDFLEYMLALGLVNKNKW
jgi:lipoprotein NlpI